MAGLSPQEQLVNFMRRIYDRGLTTTSGGNLSLLDDAGNMWITPGGIDKGGLTPGDIVRVCADGSRHGKHNPSSEYPFHRSVYRLRPDVRAVMHAHPPVTVAFSISGVIPNLSRCGAVRAVCGEAGFAQYDVPGSEALGRKVGAAFAEGHDVVLLENHGVCVVGGSIGEAYGRLEALDFFCRTQMQAVRLGGRAVLNDAAEAAPYLRYRAPSVTQDGATGVGAGETVAREKLAAMTRRAWRQNLFSSAVGVAASRLSDGSLLFPRASADRASMLESDFVRVSDGTGVGGGGELAEVMLRLFEKHPEFGAIFAAVPPHLAAYAMSGRTFDTRVIPESYILLREIPTFEIVADEAGRAALERTFSARYPVVRTLNGWVFAGGGTLHEAFDRLEVAEFSARAAIEADTLGGMRPMTERQVADLVSAFHLPR